MADATKADLRQANEIMDAADVVGAMAYAMAGQLDGAPVSNLMTILITTMVNALSAMAMAADGGSEASVKAVIDLATSQIAQGVPYWVETEKAKAAAEAGKSEEAA